VQARNSYSDLGTGNAGTLKTLHSTFKEFTRVFSFSLLKPNLYDMSSILVVAKLVCSTREDRPTVGRGVHLVAQ